MKKISRFILWLLKKTFVLAVIAFAVMYVSSFLWFKIGMSSTQTLFGLAFMEANIDIATPNTSVGDLIVAKEYFGMEAPEKYDVIVYEHFDGFNVSIVESVSTDEDGSIIYRTTPSNSDELIYIYKSDVIGELLFTADELGSLIMFALSPTFVAGVYGFFIFAILLSRYLRKRKSLVATISSSDMATEIETNKENIIADNNDTAKNKDIDAVEEAEVVNEEAEVVNEEAEVVNEEAEVVNEEAEVVNEEAEVVNEEAEVVNEEAETVNEDAETVNEEVEVVNEEAEVVNEEAEVVNEENGIEKIAATKQTSKKKKTKHCKKKSLNREKNKKKNKKR